MSGIIPFNIGINALQKKLLLAALAKDKAKALEFFEAFKKELLSFDLDINNAILKLDVDSSRLLGQLYFNLSHVQDTLLSQLKSIYKV